MLCMCELSVCVNSLCIWQVHVSVYCARRIPAHHRCTQCSIMSHLSISASYYVFCVTDIANRGLLACRSMPWISVDIIRFYEEQC